MDKVVFNKQAINVLYSEFKKINLVEFIEKETGITLNKNKDDYSCLCPMSHHNDSKPSFHVCRDENSDCWIYNCFGCGSSGTIIDFCIHYKGLNSSSEAVVYLAEKLEMKDTYEVAIRAIKNAKINVNFKKILDSEHFLASKRCFQVLKKYSGKEDIKAWVFNIYKQMNQMLSNEDISGIEKISDQAIKLYSKGSL